MARAVDDDERPLLSDVESSSTLDGANDETRGLHGEDDHDDDEEMGVAMSKRRAAVIMLSMWALIFLQSSNMSGIAMLQSRVAEDLHADEQVAWFAGAYLIALSAASPLAGRLATIFAPRALIVPVALAVALGSALTATARTCAQFLGGRVATGLGGAGVMTLSMVFVLALAGRKRRGAFLALVNVGFTVGLSFGAVVYGAVGARAGWRAIFWAQVPVALVAGVALFCGVPPGVGRRSRTKSRELEAGTWEKVVRIDYVGAVLMSIAISLLLYALAGTVRPLALAASLTMLAAFLVWEYRWAADPIIPLPVLSSRGVLFSCFAQLVFISARWTLLYYGPIFMLAVRGLAPTAAGTILIPTNLGYGGGGLLIGSLHIRRGGSFWLPSVVSYAFFCATLLAVAAIGTPTAPQSAFVVAVLLNGLATGAAMNYSFAHLLHVSAPPVHFVTTSLLGTFRGFGSSFGTAIGGGYFLRQLRDRLAAGFARLDGGGALTPERRALVIRLAGRPDAVFGGGLAPAEQAIARDAYAAALRHLWTVAALLGVGAIGLQALCGWKAGEEEQGDEQQAAAADDDLDEATAVLMASEGARED